MKWHTEHIYFPSGDIKLHGVIYLPKTEGRFPGVVMCHGMASDYRSMRPSAQQLARKGIAAFAIDMRGHGMSGGTLDGGIGQDVVAAYNNFKNHTSVDAERIGLAGHSLGALACLYAASVVNGAKALVLMSIPSDIGSMAEFWQPMRKEAERLGTPVLEFPKIGPLPYYGWLNQQVSRAWMIFRKYKMRIDIEHDTESWLSLLPLSNIDKIGDIPKLLIHSKGDKWLPYEKTVALYEKAQQPKDMVLSEGGYHVTPLLPGSLRSKWISWTASTLKGKGDR
ncbi:MAG: alpha/beta fold hydrolase [Dehalococcoidia bacterium]